jgi:diketogulonate reductase-like aldo/keto reductase
VASIPKASDPAHVKANHDAQTVVLDEDAIAALDRAFPPPRRKRQLEIV